MRRVAACWLVAAWVVLPSVAFADVLRIELEDWDDGIIYVNAFYRNDTSKTFTTVDVTCVARQNGRRVASAHRTIHEPDDGVVAPGDRLEARIPVDVGQSWANQMNCQSHSR